jgi:transcriptional regulator with XRE-family HTH domain
MRGRKNIGANFVRVGADQPGDLRHPLGGHAPAAHPAVQAGVLDAQHVRRSRDAAHAFDYKGYVHGAECSHRLTGDASAELARGDPGFGALAQYVGMTRPASTASRATNVATAAHSLGSRLKLLRERRNLDQADVAAALGVSRPTLSEWESGKKSPGRENLRGLAVYYRVSTDWLLEGGAEPIVAETAAEEAVLKALREAPDAIRDAVAAILRPYSTQPQRPEKPS